MARVKVSFSSALASLTKGEKEVEVDAGSVREIFAALESRYGEDFIKRLFDDRGNLRRFVNVNGKDVRFLGGLDVKLKSGDEVDILPAIAGG